MDHINELPDEILLNIFSHLPAANLVISQLVCTRWLGIIKGENKEIKMEDIFWSLAEHNQMNLIEKLCIRESSCVLAFFCCAVVVNKIDIARWCINQGCDLTQCGGADLIGVAIMHQNLDMIKLLHENYCPKDKEVCHWAAEVGNLEILQWLKDHDYKLGEICDIAAEKNHLNVLQWAKENGCSLSDNICIYAAENNNLDMLQWARENECPWNNKVCIRAAAKSHFEILKWAITNGCPVNNSKICSIVAGLGESDLIQWLHYAGCPWDVSTCIEAACSGHFEILKWVIENGCPVNNPSICTIIAEHGNLELLKWLRHRNCPWDVHTCIIAACHSHHEMLKWAIENGCPSDNPNICSYVAMSKKFELLKWLHHVGCPWDAETYYYVKRFGNTEMIQWVLERGCSTWYQKIKYWLKDVTLEDIAKWGEKNQIPWNEELKCDSSYSLDSCYQVLQWAVKNGYKPKRISNFLLQSIVDHEHQIFLEWIIELGFKDDHICDYAAANKKFKILFYLVDHGFRYSKATSVIIELYQELSQFQKDLH